MNEPDYPIRFSTDSRVEKNQAGSPGPWVRYRNQRQVAADRNFAAMVAAHQRPVAAQLKEE
jgi:hypothetical protein